MTNNEIIARLQFNVEYYEMMYTTSVELMVGEYWVAAALNNLCNAQAELDAHLDMMGEGEVVIDIDDTIGRDMLDFEEEEWHAYNDNNFDDILF